jgi:hypothetical protein
VRADDRCQGIGSGANCLGTHIAINKLNRSSIIVVTDLRRLRPGFEDRTYAWFDVLKQTQPDRIRL